MPLQSPSQHLFARRTQDLNGVQPLLKRMADDLQITIFGFDYPGYGTATGKPSEAGCFAAASAVWDYVREQVPTAKIVVFGRSLGSGPGEYAS